MQQSEIAAGLSRLKLHGFSFARDGENLRIGTGSAKLTTARRAWLSDNKAAILDYLDGKAGNSEPGRHYPPSTQIDRLRAALEYFIMDLGVRFYIDTGGMCQAEISPAACASLTQDQADAIDDLCLYHGELAARARVLRTGGDDMDCVSLTF